MMFEKVRIKKGYVALMLAALGILAGCGTPKEKGKTGNVSHNLRFESYTFDVIGEKTDSVVSSFPGANYIRYSGQGMLPMDIGDSVVKNLRDSLLSMVRVSYDIDSGASPETGKDVVITDLPVSETEACGLFYSSLSLTLATPRVMVWEGYRESYACGAAHGNRAVSFLNYSVESGNIITLESLMKPGYEKTLEEAIRAKLKEKDVQLIVKPEDITLPNQFEITTTGILFSYDPYQIAPYSEGIVQVEIPLDELDGVLLESGKYLLTGQLQN